MERRQNPIATMLVLTIASLTVYLVRHWKPALYGCFAFALAGILSPGLSSRISHAWMWFARGLGRISNAVLLSLIFLLVVTPVGLIRRLRKKDRLRRFDGTATSNFSDRDHIFRKEDLERLG